MDVSDIDGVLDKPSYVSLFLSDDICGLSGHTQVSIAVQTATPLV